MPKRLFLFVLLVALSASLVLATLIFSGRGSFAAVPPPASDPGSADPGSANSAPAPASTYSNPFRFGIKAGGGGQGGALPGIPQGVQACTQGDFGQCLLWLLDKTLRLVYTLTLFWAVIMLVWTGIKYVSSRGEVKDIHSSLVWALWGVVVAVLAFGVVKGLELTLSGGESPGGTTTGGITAGGTTTGGTTVGGPGQRPTGVVAKIVFKDLQYNTRLGRFVGFSDSEPPLMSCSFTVLKANVTKGETGLPELVAVGGAFSIKILEDAALKAETGDAIRLTFRSTDPGCVVSQSTVSFTITGTGGGLVRPPLKPQIVINDFIYDDDNRVFRGFYSVKSEEEGQLQPSCDLVATVYNVTKSLEMPPVLISGILEEPLFVLRVPAGTAPGDLMRISFKSNRCQVDRAMFSYTIPKGLTQLKPVYVKVDEIDIFGSQYYNVNLTANNKSLLENILFQLGLQFAGNLFYDPPFFGYFKYTAINQNQTEVTCTVRALVKGARVQGIGTGSLSVVAFTYPTSVYLRVAPTGVGAVQRVADFTPPLSNGTYERIRWITIDTIGPCTFDLGGFRDKYPLILRGGF